MRRVLLNQRRSLAVAIVLLLVGSLLPPKTGEAIASPLRQVVVPAVGLLALPLKYVSDRVRPGRRLAADLPEQDKLSRDYLELHAYVMRLEDELARSRAQVEQISRARQLLRLQERSTALVPATVVQWSGRPTDPVLTIDQGSASGVAPGHAVVDGFNLVGRVVSVGPGWAAVRLVTTPGSSVTVRLMAVPRQAQSREAVASLKVSADGRRMTTEVAAENVVGAGYLAFLSDPTWPASAQGFVVGKVVAVEPWKQANPLLFSQLVVEPMAMLPSLPQVTVLVPVLSERGGTAR